jgi:hypothetical protein
MHTTTADLCDINIDFDSSIREAESAIQVIRQLREELPTMSREERIALRTMIDNVKAIMAETR